MLFRFKTTLPPLCKCSVIAGMKESSEPNLAPPGSGLPKLELMAARVIFGWRLRTGTRAAFNEVFRRERRNVLELAGGLDENSGAKRVLIKRIRGVEDSSRYWSVFMTLDHLQIVQSQVAMVICQLLKGVIPQGKASTAKVKPRPGATIASVKEFDASCDQLLAAVAEPSNLQTEATYEHPWFGELNAEGWHALAALHLGIHRRQIEQILKGL